QSRRNGIRPVDGNAQLRQDRGDRARRMALRSQRALTIDHRQRSIYRLLLGSRSLPPERTRATTLPHPLSTKILSDNASNLLRLFHSRNRCPATAEPLHPEIGDARPCSQTPDNPSPHRIEVQIADYFKEVDFFLTDDRLVPILE